MLASGAGQGAQTGSGFEVASAGASAPPAVSVKLSSTAATASEVAYQISFTANAALTASGSITIKAPGGTTFSSSDCSYTVYDGRSTQGAGCRPVTVGGGGNTVSVGSGISISNGDPVTLTVDGTVNSSAAGTKSLSVTAGAAAMTGPYTLTSPTAVGNLALTTSSESVTATEVTYAADFTASNGLTSGFSQFILKAPAGTTLPAGGCNVYVESDSTTAQSNGCLSASVSPEGNTATLTAGLTSYAGDSISITVNGVANGSTAGPQTLAASTTSDPVPATTSYQLVAATSVKDLAVTLGSPSAQATELSDTLSFTSTGGLTDGYSTISVPAPPGVVLPQPSGCNVYAVTDNRTTQSNGCPNVSVAAGGGSATVIVPLSAAPGDSIALAVNGVANPTSSGTGNFSLWTTSDPVTVTKSVTFRAPAAISDLALSSTSYASGADADYTITFAAAHQLNAFQGQVEIQAPAGTVFPTASGGPAAPATTEDASPGCGYFSNWDENNNNGWNCPPTEVSGSDGSDDNDATVTVDVTMRSKDPVEIIARGVKNPKFKKGEHLELRVRTTSDPKWVEVPFPLTPSTSVKHLAVTETSRSATATEVTYAATFTAASGLDAGVDVFPGDTITLTAPVGASFASTSSCSPYEVVDNTNGQNASCITATVGSSGHSVTIYTPITIRPGDSVTVVANAVSNPSATVKGDVEVMTGTDPIAVTTPVTIVAPTKVTGPSLSVAGSSPSNYTVGFSSTSGLTSDYSQITLVAPSGVTFLAAGCGVYTVTDATDGQSDGCLTVAVSPGGNTAVITMGVDIRPNDGVSLVVDGVTGPNPSSLRLSTTSDPVVVKA